jgi:hypothetical protein
MPRSMTWWIRAFLISSALRGLQLGIKGLIGPELMPIPLQFTALNAAFVAALYLAGTVGLVLTLFARDRADARPFLIGVGVLTTLLLSVTLMRWSEFDTRLSLALIGWVGSYVFDPLAVLALIATHRIVRAAKPGRHRLTPLFTIEAIVLGTLGLLALVLPETVSALWPWKIPPLLSQLYSCFFISLAVIALLVARENRPAPIRNFTLSSLALMAFVLLVSLPYLSRFTAGPARWIWFGTLLLGVVAFGAALIWHTPLEAPKKPKTYETQILDNRNRAHLDQAAELIIQGEIIAFGFNGIFAFIGAAGDQ